MIEDGADFKGSIEIDRSATEEAGKNISSLARTRRRRARGRKAFNDPAYQAMPL